MQLINIKHVQPDDSESVGEKAALLGALSKEFNVAPGFVIPKSWFDSLLAYNKAAQKLTDLRRHELENSNAIQELMVNLELPTSMTEAIKESYYALNIRDDEPINTVVKKEQDPIVVLRSSLPSKAKGGVSILHVQGKDKLIKGIVALYASLFTETAIQAREEAGIAPQMGIIMQKMIVPRISGAIYSEDNNIIVKACYGLSDENMSLDKYVLDPQTLAIKTETIAKQETAYMQDPTTLKLSKVKLSETHAEAPKLNEKQITVIANLWKQAATDGLIEFIIDNETYYFVQAVPLKTQAASGPEQEASTPDEESLTDDTKNIVDSDESAIPVERTTEPPEDEAAEAKSGDNAIFSLFNANRGDEMPEIPSEPKQETKPTDPEPAEPADRSISLEEDTEEEVLSEAVNPDEVVETAPKESAEEKVISTEDLSDPVGVGETDDLGNEKTDEIFDTGDVSSNEDTPGSEDSHAHESISPNPEIDKPDVNDIVMQSQSESQGPDYENVITNTSVDPLTKDEWQQTLDMEHTRVLISYDMAIVNAIKKRYQKLFGRKPDNFSSAIVDLKREIEIPNLNGITRIHGFRNAFLKNHETVGFEELAEAHTVTMGFLRDF